MDEQRIDFRATVSIDSDESGPAVQINGVDSQNVSPMFTPDEAEQLAEDLLLGAEAARQAAKDGYGRPAQVVAFAVSAPQPDHWTPIPYAGGADLEGLLSSSQGVPTASVTLHAEALIALYAAVGRQLTARCQTQSRTTHDYTQLEYNECTGGTHCSMCPVTRTRETLVKAFERIEALR